MRVISNYDNAYKMFCIKLAKNTKYYNGYLWKLYFLSLIVHVYSHFFTIKFPCIFTAYFHFISFFRRYTNAT